MVTHLWWLFLALVGVLIGCIAIIFASNFGVNLQKNTLTKRVFGKMRAGGVRNAPPVQPGQLNGRQFLKLTPERR
jgi:ABC-type antimicrobial peptide transport system permease subunit